MNSKQKIVFVAPFLNSFIKNDLDLLSQEFTIITNTYRWDKKIATPLFLIHQFFFFLLRTPSVSSIVIQFGGYWSLIPTLFGKLYNKPVFIILHGTDCASLPSIGYGSYRKTVLKLFCKLSYKFTTKLLPVSDSLIKTTNTYSNNKQEELQGVYNHFPKLTTPYTTISNGLEIKKWNTTEPIKEQILENCVYAIEETKTDSSESRNTSAGQRATKFSFLNFLKCSDNFKILSVNNPTCTSDEPTSFA